MNLLLMSKNKRGRRQKMPKAKIVRKDAYMRFLKAKGFCTESQKGILSLYFDSFSPSNAKRSKIKIYLKVNLASLTFRLRTVFSSFENDGNFAMLVHHEKIGYL